jgi:hypothetical protein
LNPAFVYGVVPSNVRISMRDAELRISRKVKSSTTHLTSRGRAQGRARRGLAA